jgi:hypothetical protein
MQVTTISWRPSSKILDRCFDVISVKPKSLKATVRKHDLMLVQSMEREITTLFGDTSYKQCGLAAKNSMDS